MQLDIGRAFTFIGDDPRWVTKLLIGGGLVIATFLALFTVVGWIFIAAILTGYVVQLTRNVSAGQPQPLPEWDNWGARMIDGFKALVVMLVYALPSVLIGIVFQVPASVLNATSNSGTSGAGVALGAIGSCLGFFVGIAVALVVPVAIGRYATTSSIGEALRFGGVFATLRQYFGTYVIIALLTAMVLPLVGSLGLIACGIGLPFTLFYAQLVNYHLYGQAARQAQGLLPAPGQPYQQPLPY